MRYICVMYLCLVYFYEFKSLFHSFHIWYVHFDWDSVEAKDRCSLFELGPYQYHPRWNCMDPHILARQTRNPGFNSMTPLFMYDNLSIKRICVALNMMFNVTYNNRRLCPKKPEPKSTAVLLTSLICIPQTSMNFYMHNLLLVLLFKFTHCFVFSLLMYFLTM